mgnify:CR=1 FL=1
MKKLATAAAIATLLGVSASAAAFWGGGPGYGNNNMMNDMFGNGDGYGDFSMNMSGGGSGRGYGRSDNRYYNNNGYGAPYGAPPAPPVAQAAPPVAPVAPTK